jgi:5-methylcytosine-specific restriction endonuclease McrA
MTKSESNDTKTLCGRCGQEIEEPSKILDHIVFVHNDQEAGWLLNNLNRLLQRGQKCMEREV